MATAPRRASGNWRTLARETLEQRIQGLNQNIKKLEADLGQIIIQRQQIEQKLTSLQTEIHQIQSELTRHDLIEKQKVDRTLQIQGHITSLTQLQERLEVLEKYNQLVSSNGIPKKLLIQYLMQIEAFVNCIISISTFYQLKIGYDPDKNNIYSRI